MIDINWDDAAGAFVGSLAAFATMRYVAAVLNLDAWIARAATATRSWLNLTPTTAPSRGCPGGSCA